MMHLFAQYPCCPNGLLVPIQSKNPDTVEHLAEILKNDYQIEIKPDKMDGKEGYRDQHGRFLCYRFLKSPEELGEFMDSLGASEDFFSQIAEIH